MQQCLELALHALALSELFVLQFLTFQSFSQIFVADNHIDLHVHHVHFAIARMTLSPSHVFSAIGRHKCGPLLPARVLR